MVEYELIYSPGEVRQLIKKYQELQSVVEIVAERYDWTTYRTGNLSDGKKFSACLWILSTLLLC